MATIIVLFIVLTLLGLALRSMKRGSSSCHGGCSECSKGCHSSNGNDLYQQYHNENIT